MDKTCITCNSNGPFKPRNKTCNECILKKNTKCPHGVKEKKNCKECGGGNICLHGKMKRFCTHCNGSALCEHKKNKNMCKECKGNQICEHNKSKYDCRDCKGSSFCIHDKRKYLCKECGGKGLCEHGKQKKNCKECCPKCEHNKIKKRCKECNLCEHQKNKNSCIVCTGTLCEHHKQKRFCKECGGSGICEHGKRKSACKDCKGSEICEHEKRKSFCKECKGNQICEHNRIKYSCKDCKGKGICKHNKLKNYCRDCEGKAYCPHDKQKNDCLICKPENACQNCKSLFVKKSYRFYPYCFACYCVLNPDVDIPKRYKIKENYVKDFLLDEFKEDITIVFDKIVEGGCSRRRPDVRIDMGSHIIIVECDEDQHKGYSCENKRMMEIFQDCGNRPIVFLRFNPDSYTKNMIKYGGCFKITGNGLGVNKDEFKKRMECIVKDIDNYLIYKPEKELTVHHYFYN